MAESPGVRKPRLLSRNGHTGQLEGMPSLFTGLSQASEHRGPAKNTSC